MINDALLNNKKLSLPNTINIKFQKDLQNILIQNYIQDFIFYLVNKKWIDFWKWIVKIIIKIFSQK